MPTILLTGAGGQTGRELLALQAEYPGLTLLPAGRSDLDITSAGATERFFDAHVVDYCINCAAYTAVDLAERDEEKAWLVNAEGPGNLGRACAAHEVPLIHLSSDYVYHNTLNRPLRESDPTNPQSVYARSKLAGEQQARESHAQTMIIRTSWLYGAVGHNFVRTMLRLGPEKGELRVVYDQIGAPTYARDLAQVLLTLVGRHGRGDMAVAQWANVYNFANEGVTSWYDFALAIFEEGGIGCLVHPIESKDFPAQAPRPPFSVLSKEKIKTAFGLAIPHWRESLRHCLRRMAGEGKR